MIIISWMLAAIILFAPGLLVASLVLFSRRRHRRLRARIGAYGYLAR